MASARRRDWRRLLFLAFIGGCFLGLLALRAWADDLHSSAQRLSDGAFALLGSIPNSAEDVSGAMASFAGDAHTLASALGKHDRGGAASAMAALVEDQKAVDQALAKNPGAVDSSRWRSLETGLASLESRVPADARAASSRVSSGSRSRTVPPPPEETSALGPAPKIVIASRVYDDKGVEIKGYFEGQDLKSAGIYDGDTLIAPVKVDDMTGRDRVNFDFRLEHVTPTEAVRVSDSVGRTVEARVAPDVLARGNHDAAHDKVIELGAGSLGTSSLSSGTSGPPAMIASKGKNTVEIPSKSPSRRHMHKGANLGLLSDVQVNVLGVLPSPANRYEVIGQISGEGIKRAGIYVDGRLVKAIPMAAGRYTSFNVAFTMLGKEASIRVYGNGNNYVESGLDLSSGYGGVYGLNPRVAPVNPYAYGVNPYGPAYPYRYPVNPYGGVNPYGSANPYAPAPYGYGPPLRGYPAPRPVRPSWPFP